MLVLRAYSNWDWPKGLCEPGEDPLATAIREAKEEADLGDLVFPWGNVHADTAPYAKGKVATYFIARTEQTEIVLPINPELGHPEHDEGRWVTAAEAAGLMPARLQPILIWACHVVNGTSEVV